MKSVAPMSSMKLINKRILESNVHIHKVLSTKGDHVHIPSLFNVDLDSCRS